MRPAGEGALALAGVAAIRRQVQQVVEQIDAGGAQAEGQEAQQRLPQQQGVQGLVGHRQGDEQQQVLQPLMQAQGLEILPQGGGRVLKAAFDAGQPPRPLRHPAGAFTRMAPRAWDHTCRSTALLPA
jgi:hypothetical protein